MSIFSSPQKRIELSALKVQRLRAELADAEAEQRAARVEAIVERLKKCKDDTLRPSGQHGTGWAGQFGQAPSYSASSLARQVSSGSANEADLSRIEAWLDAHEAHAR